MKWRNMRWRERLYWIWFYTFVYGIVAIAGLMTVYVILHHGECDRRLFGPFHARHYSCE